MSRDMMKRGLLIAGLILGFIVFPVLRAPEDTSAYNFHIFLQQIGSYPLTYTEYNEYEIEEMEENAIGVEIDKVPYSYWTIFSYSLLGYGLSPHFLLNGIGCVFIAFAGLRYEAYNNYFKKVKYAAAVSAFCCLMMPFVPYFVQEKPLFMVTIFLYLIQIVAKLVFLVAIANGAQKQTDDYVYMEVGKDLRFAAELYGFFAFAGLILSFILMLMGFRILWWIDFIGQMVAILYFIIKFYSYDKKLKLFALPEAVSSEAEHTE